MSKLRELEKPASYVDLSRALNRPIGAVAKAASWLSEKRLVNITEQKVLKASLGAEGLAYLEMGFPERRLVEALVKLGGAPTLEKCRESSQLTEQEFNIAVLWAKRKGWISVDREGPKTVLKVSKYPEKGIDERAVEKISRGTSHLDELGRDLREACLELSRRPSVVDIIEERIHLLEITSTGRTIPVEELGREEVTQLSPELLASGKWREVSIGRFNVRAPTPVVFAGKKHPLQKLVEAVKEIFVELGFEEIRGPLMELAFWNFDALFQPQDHPAREMHDTFYIKSPDRGRLPAPSLVQRVKSVHENGALANSIGWRYSWSKDEASRLILRTHTTATTIRHLASHREPPVKVFSVDRIYRNERVDWRRIAEFHQIEGIAMERRATLRDLMGVITEFYGRLGLTKIRFYPSYFPYTEPSAEVRAYLPSRRTWLEMGGMGIFRPEVTLPLGVRHPVIAWGLGLERLAATLLELEDIRTLYFNDLAWVRSLPTTYLENILRKKDIVGGG